MVRGEAEKGWPRSPAVGADNEAEAKDAAVEGDTEKEDEGNAGENCSMDEVALSAPTPDPECAAAANGTC